ncbi:hypothetical protein [Paenibacillus sp. JCM 10914]|uniref:hypothetical protein n=1 Tax=Paenibacillus sp. JCM 10914 TaxID=1236974 RepID=UPI00068AE9A1|nr:hypothetical protein [Paenibacillus sp. JCM 10914]
MHSPDHEREAAPTVISLREFGDTTDPEADTQMAMRLALEAAGASRVRSLWTFRGGVIIFTHIMRFGHLIM